MRLTFLKRTETKGHFCLPRRDSIVVPFDTVCVNYTGRGHWSEDFKNKQFNLRRVELIMNRNNKQRKQKMLTNQWKTLSVIQSKNLP